MSRRKSQWTRDNEKVQRVAARLRATEPRGPRLADPEADYRRRQVERSVADHLLQLTDPGESTE